MVRTGFVHLASILHLCPFGTHAGSVSCRRICGARGVSVRMLHPCDMQNRRKRDRNPGLGSTTNKGRLVNDARASHTFVPQTKAPQTWHVPDKVGQDCETVCQYISAVLVKRSQPSINPSRAVLGAFSEVDDDDDSVRVDSPSGHRLAAVVNTHGTTEPFPMYRCAPALYTPCGVQDEQKYTDELRQWTERNADGPESCALGVEGGVGAGGVVATHADGGPGGGWGRKNGDEGRQGCVAIGSWCWCYYFGC